MLHKKYYRILSLILCTALFSNAVPHTVNAAQLYDKNDTYVINEESSEPEAEQETERFSNMERKLLLKQKLLQKQLPNRKRKPILRAVILKRKVKQIRLLNLKQSLKRNLKQSLQRTLQNYKTLWKNSTPLPTPSL